MKKAAATTLALCLTALPLYAAPAANTQTAKKLRVLAAPGITQNQQPNNWHNTFGVSGDNLVLTCPKCMPIQTVSVPKNQIVENATGKMPITTGQQES